MIRDARVDLPDEAETGEGRQLRHRQRDRQAVEHHLEAPADSRLRDRSQELRSSDSLRGDDPGQIALRALTCDVEPPGRSRGGEAPAVGRRQRWKPQTDDHADPAGRLVSWDRELARADARHSDVAERALDVNERGASRKGRHERRHQCEKAYRTAQGDRNLAQGIYARGRDHRLRRQTRFGSRGGEQEVDRLGDRAAARRCRGRACLHLPGRAHREERSGAGRVGVQPARDRVRRALGRGRRACLPRGGRGVRRRPGPARALGRLRRGRRPRGSLHGHAP